MANPGLPHQVVELLRERVHGFEALEALLRLHAEPREWSASEMAERLNADRDIIATAMDELGAASLVVASGEGRERRWRYGPRDAELASTVTSLVELYSSSRLEVLHEMTENALERIRSSAVATFADSFRLGKKRQ